VYGALPAGGGSGAPASITQNHLCFVVLCFLICSLKVSCVEQAVRQQELVYNAQYQLAAAEHRVARASGQRSADESAALTAALAAAREALVPAKAEQKDVMAALRTAEAVLGAPCWCCISTG